jgi:hypothetical protein
VRIDRHVTNRHSGRLERLIRNRVARVLDPDLSIAIQQGPDDEIDRRLRAGRDDDLVGITMHRSRGSQILAELLPQLRETPRV